MTASTPLGLSLEAPPFLSLVELSCIVKNTSGAPVSSAWTLRGSTANGPRQLAGFDLAAIPGNPISNDPNNPTAWPFAGPRVIGAGASETFLVQVLAQFPKSITGLHFTFQAPALKVVSKHLLITRDAAFIALGDYSAPGFYWESPMPRLALDPANPNAAPVLGPTPKTLPYPLLDWTS